MSAFVLPTYGMPCCGHTIRQHADDSARWSLLPPACGCCRSGARLGAALVLMADEPATNAPLGERLSRGGMAAMEARLTGGSTPNPTEAPATNAPSPTRSNDGERSL